MSDCRKGKIVRGGLRFGSRMKVKNFSWPIGLTDSHRFAAEICGSVRSVETGASSVYETLNREELDMDNLKSRGWCVDAGLSWERNRWTTQRIERPYRELTGVNGSCFFIFAF